MPIKIVVIPGLTLTEVTDADIERIADSAGPGSEVVVTAFAAAEAHITDADVVLGILPPKLFNAAKKLRWVQSISSGVDSFMYPEFINSHVVLTSEKGLVGEHLADHGFGLLLMLTRQLHLARDLQAESWQHRPALRAQEIELTDRTMTIIGLGGTGRAMARRAVAFGMQVIAVDRDPVEPMQGVELLVGEDRLADVLGQTDVLSVCCPLTESTHGLINQRTLGQLKPGAFLVNVTRGEVMVEDDLVAALKSRHLRGAALDVAPREPLPADSELWQLDNVVMTPHTAGASQFRAQRNLDRFVANVGRFVRGETLEGIIDKTLGY